MAEFDELMVLRHDFSRLEKSLIDTAVLFMSEKSGASGAVPDFLFFPRFLWPMVVDKLKEHCKLSKRVKNADYYGKVILENGLGPPGHCDEDGEFVDLTKMDLDRL